MSSIDYRQTALELLDNYLAGNVPREVVWQWAQDVIISDDFDELPADLQDAIHGMWLLHDSEGSWVPETDELRGIRDNLAE